MANRGTDLLPVWTSWSHPNWLQKPPTTRRKVDGKQTRTSVKGQPEVLNANINAPHLEKSAYVLKELIVDATEAVAFVNGYACLALLDTGSQVTSIAKSFYDRHLFNQIIS